MKFGSITSLQQIFDRVRTNRVFELFVMSIIIFSALVIGAKTYDMPALLLLLVSWLDRLITVFFVVEITIRYLGERRKSQFFRDGWNLFDSCIVIISLIPTGNSEMALLGRLLRIFRVLRMISIVPELRLLLNSLFKALPQLGYVVGLMFIIFYIYAAIGSMLFAEVNPVLWGNVAIAMLTLFRVMTFEDWTDVMYETMEVYPYSWVFYLTFIFFTAFAFLNMVIGIVVNVMEDEKAIARQGGDISDAELAARLDELRHILEARHKERHPD